MAAPNPLFLDRYPVAEGLELMIPTVGEILAREEAYYNAISSLIATPFDMMVQLEDMGLDFTAVTDFELFCLLFLGLGREDTSLIFGDTDVSGFAAGVSEDGGELVLENRTTGLVIDRAVYDRLCGAVCKIHFLEKTRSRAGNAEAKAYLLSRARKRRDRAAAKGFHSQLQDLIVAMVCTGEYKYDLAATRDLTIYQFNACVRQVIRKIGHDHLMTGVYTGNVDTKKLDPGELSWLPTP